MGIAWNVYNDICFELSDEIIIEGCDREYRNSDNLAYASYKRAMSECGIKASPLHITFLNTCIPVSRGLGSSAALISAGVAAADRLHSLGLGKEGISRIAAMIEGHPDNTTPSVYGGFQIASLQGDTLFRSEASINDVWSFCVLVPDFELSTAEARKALPERYSRSEAVFNISRAGLLIKALETGDTDLLRYAQDDVIHQPYRLPLIPGYEKAFSAALESGAVSVCISGAGPTILCTFADQKGKAALEERMLDLLPNWACKPVSPSKEGTTYM